MQASIERSVWNLPVEQFPQRATTYWDLIAGATDGGKPLDILEIGVFRGGLLRGLLERSDIQVNTYTGVDPYVGDAADSYTGSYYWTDGDGSNSVWKKSKELFDRAGFQLYRNRSHEFYAAHVDRSWDVIIVDGDHRYRPALWDLHHWFKRLRPGGVLIADDYANCDTPDVTRAVNEFVRLNEPNFAQLGYHVLPFQNAGKEIPISLTIVLFRKVLDPVDTASWRYRPVRQFVSGRYMQLLRGLARRLWN